VEIPSNVHSHKVRVIDDLMFVNHEPLRRGDPSVRGGMKIYDIAKPDAPCEVSFFETGKGGAHRFELEDGLATITPELDDYCGNIIMLLDVSNPSKPREISRWWLEGQHVGGRETPKGEKWAPRMHPIKRGDKLYVGCWMDGFAIVDVSDPVNPKTISRFNWIPPYRAPTHTVLPLPFSIMDRSWLLVTDEEISDQYKPPSAFMWMVDVTSETNPVPVSTFQVTPSEFQKKGGRFGAHQPNERIFNHLTFLSWFSGGLRVVDIANPYRPEEVGFYIPEPLGANVTAQTNDVFIDERGLIYIIDRFQGLHIVEYTG